MLVPLLASLLRLALACAPGDPPPQFSNNYIVSGVLTIPYAELREPFKAWYDNPNGVSRIDYYSGTQKTYQLSTYGQYGTSVKVIPVTTETEKNVIGCFQVNGTNESKIQIQTVLPDLTGFSCQGTESINGVKAEKWRKTEIIEEKDNKYTIYIRWKKQNRSPSSLSPIPVRYEMKGYNTLLGSHYDHYYIDYNSYKAEKPAPETFIIEKNETCTNFPGPGRDHIYAFNPMKEFIENHEEHLEASWNDFIKTHDKNYVTLKEVHKRKYVFKQNMRFIHSKNRANLGYTLAANHLSDRNDAELAVLRGRKYRPGYNGGLPFPQNLRHDVPQQFDWRIYGAVTPVKDQSVCGSCWTFGTTGAVEGAYFVKYGELLPLSEQALVDCSWGYGNNGCDGGEDSRAYQWIIKHGGLPLENEYPYLGSDGFCRSDEHSKKAKMSGFVNVTSGDENALKVAIRTKGPVSVAIDAAHKTFSFYSNGVYYEPDCKNDPEGLDHAVLAVGYGELNGKSYWLIKNSWSNYWGNDGYILMSRKDNNCGVMTMPTYVIPE